MAESEKQKLTAQGAPLISGQKLPPPSQAVPTVSQHKISRFGTHPPVMSHTPEERRLAARPERVIRGVTSNPAPQLPVPSKPESPKLETKPSSDTTPPETPPPKLTELRTQDVAKLAIAELLRVAHQVEVAGTAADTMYQEGRIDDETLRRIVTEHVQEAHTGDVTATSESQSSESAHSTENQPESTFTPDQHGPAQLEQSEKLITSQQTVLPPAPGAHYRTAMITALAVVVIVVVVAVLLLS